ncbi:MAG: sensor histidine kinase [Gemmatimonadaceae bacterium]
MQLAAFITSHSEDIIADWMSFASTHIVAAKGLDDEALRDHAAEMLDVIVADMKDLQSHSDQKEKSWGLPTVTPSDVTTAATSHGAQRAIHGYTINDVVAEYRAMRASVLRRWALVRESHDADGFDQLTRFNEAVDQALSESVARYARNVEYSREMFVAVLGHDLRSPLSAVLMACQAMLAAQGLDETVAMHARRIARSAKRMNEMVSDLLDFTRARLGNGLPISREPLDFVTLAKDAVEELVVAQPDLNVEYSGDDVVVGHADTARLQQVLANLLGNAAQHGARNSRIKLDLRTVDDHVQFRVHNTGAEISPLAMTSIFSPFKRLMPGTNIDPRSTSLGLGLYIAQEIVTSHGGTIHVKSNASDGTEFTVRLPNTFPTTNP